MKVEPVARRSLTDGVVDRVRELIDREQLIAGDRLPGEMRLVEQLQVSRPVLREALGRLETIGLIRIRRGDGIFVGDRENLSGCAKMIRSAMAISPRDLLKYAEVRWGIECYSARIAAERATAEDLAELERLLDEMDNPSTGYDEAVQLDIAFHRKLLDITGNEVMQNLMEVILEFVIAGMVQTTPRPRDRNWSRPLHRAIFDAVRSADPDGAESAMRLHMDAVLQRLSGNGKKPTR